MQKQLLLGYSPCPNDTYIFHALTSGLVDTGGLVFTPRLEDVETLNTLALREELDITKVSFAALAELREDYGLLRSGGALGRGCGPLIIARQEMDVEALKGRRIAIPGQRTTAFMLMRLMEPALGDNVVVMPFDRIMAAVRDGDVDAGLIIHEGRFTYPDYGLKEIEDLGRWWESATGHPIPLGCIIARRALGSELALRVEALVRRSLQYAMDNPSASIGYIKEHSQEMAVGVIRQHIGLYVNDYSLDLGEDGVAAVKALFNMAVERGLIAPADKPLFF